MKLYLVLLILTLMVAGCTGQQEIGDVYDDDDHEHGVDDVHDDIGDDTDDDIGDTTDDVEPIISTATLGVSEQILVGDQITIDFLFLDKPGYVVIHADAGGSPGSFIGNSELLSGEQNNVVVTIDETLADNKVHAMLHYDNDDGVYSTDDDVPVIVDESVLVKSIEILEVEQGSEPVTEHTIELRSSGFVPQTRTIRVGDIVLFTNKENSKSWPASDRHPIHTVYPGSGISKCGTAEEVNIFDACKGLGRDEIYMFTFNEVGSWEYHDHLRPSLTGTIIVE